MIVRNGVPDPAGARSAPLEPAAGAEKFGRFYRFVTISKQFLVLRTACIIGTCSQAQQSISILPYISNRVAYATLISAEREL